MKISAVIITFNEEANVADAIASVDWADEILIVDSNSTDRTVDIAKALGARAIIREWRGFSDQKQFATDSAENDWILSIDADERVSPQLKAEIENLRQKGSKALGYKIPRLTFYMGCPIRHSGWYPDRQLRFFNRTKGHWKDVLVHESFQMDPEAVIDTLNGDILHYTVSSVAEHHKMIGERYAPLAAEQMFKDGKRSSISKIIMSGPAAFLRTYILKCGFLDGLPGFAIAWFAAQNSFLKNLLLWELERSSENGNRR